MAVWDLIRIMIQFGFVFRPGMVETPRLADAGCSVEFGCFEFNSNFIQFYKIGRYSDIILLE